MGPRTARLPPCEPVAALPVDHRVVAIVGAAGRAGAWLAAAIFAVHPVHVESVAWVTERKNVLSLLLALGSLRAYLAFSPPERSCTDRLISDSLGGWGYYALALLLYVGALFSKTVTASVPAVLLVIYWWKQGRIPWREALRLAPFFAIGLSLAGLTAWMEKNIVGASGQAWDLTPLDRMLIAGRALWFYAAKLVWPHPLVFFYPRWTVDSSAHWQYWFPLTAIVVVIVLYWLRHRLGRGPLAAVLIFAGVLVPALGFFDVYPFMFSFVADHFQYHASIGLIALAAAAFTLLAKRWTGPTSWLSSVFAAAALIALAVTARFQTAVYQDAQSLWERTVALNPDSWAAQFNLGCLLNERGKYPQAIECFQASLKVHPNPMAGTVHLSWGLSLARLRNYDQAMEQYREARQNMPATTVFRAGSGGSGLPARTEAVCRGARVLPGSSPPQPAGQALVSVRRPRGLPAGDEAFRRGRRLLSPCARAHPRTLDVECPCALRELLVRTGQD